MRRSLLAALLAGSAAVVAVAGPAQATTYGNHDVHGDIETEYLHLGGTSSFLGLPTTDEKGAPDGVGRFNNFKGGTIYWTPSTNAHEVHGALRSKWVQLGAEGGVLGYPIQDQNNTPKVFGQFSIFQFGSVYTSPASGTHEVHGAIRDAWASIGYENSSLGFPITDEHDVPGGRRNNFEHGYIVWRPSTGAVIHTH